MLYTSKTTPEGNSSCSYDSQAEADARAKALDDSGCTYCTRCTDCTYCTRCTDCTGCTRCTYCTGCTDCTDCTRCTRCTDCTGCTGCTDCTGCTGCTDCTDCTGAVIQAGHPDGWPCYGWLKNGALFIHCGCRRKTLTEARAYWANKPDRREVLAAVEYLATIAAFRDWNLGE